MDVFISYSDRDREQADEIIRKLEKNHISYFSAPMSIEGGDPYKERIRDSLIRCKELFILVSPNSIKSEWVISEWGAAWVLGKRIVPILYQCQSKGLPSRLSDLQYRNFHELDKIIREFQKRCQLQTYPSPDKKKTKKKTRAKIRQKSAAIPYRFLNKDIQILLITSSKKKNWTIPKGSIEANLSFWASAHKEALEEGGVVGNVSEKEIGDYDEAGENVKVYLLRVDFKLKKSKWEESNKRKRRWVMANNLKRYVKDKDLLEIIESGVEQLRTKAIVKEL